MKIILNIPEEFELEFTKDRFQEIFERINMDVIGRQKKDTLEMINKALKEAQIVNQ